MNNDENSNSKSNRMDKTNSKDQNFYSNSKIKTSMRNPDYKLSNFDISHGDILKRNQREFMINFNQVNQSNSIARNYSSFLRNNHYSKNYPNKFYTINANPLFKKNNAKKMTSQGKFYIIGSSKAFNYIRISEYTICEK